MIIGDGLIRPVYLPCGRFEGNRFAFEMPSTGFFGKRALVLPCNVSVEYLQDAESHLSAYGYQAVLYDPERPDETELKAYDWVYVLNRDGIPDRTRKFIERVDGRRVAVVNRWPEEFA